MERVNERKYEVERVIKMSFKINEGNGLLAEDKRKKPKNEPTDNRFRSVLR